MTHSKRIDPEPPPVDLATVCGWTAAGASWGELSFDQADGFAPVDDTELPGSDLNDDRGYGHGV